MSNEEFIGPKKPHDTTPSVVKSGEHTGKKLAELSAAEKKALVLEALAHEGYSPYQSAIILNISKQSAYRYDRQMRQGILSPLIKKARAAVTLLVEGKRVGDMAEVKGSDVIQASKMVIDRYEPIITKIEQKSLRADLTLTTEDRQKYLQMLGMLPQITTTNAITVIPAPAHEHEDEEDK